MVMDIRPKINSYNDALSKLARVRLSRVRLYCKRTRPHKGNGNSAIAGGKATMVEKKIELRRRRARAKKMDKLKAKLAVAKDKDRDGILAKIHRISPWWMAPAAK